MCDVDDIESLGWRPIVVCEISGGVDWFAKVFGVQKIVIRKFGQEREFTVGRCRVTNRVDRPSVYSRKTVLC